MTQAVYKIFVNGVDIFSRTVEVARRRLTISVPINIDVVVSTLANDFSLTQSSMPWLWADDGVLAVTSGPPTTTPFSFGSMTPYSASPQSEWNITGIDENGVTGTVEMQVSTGSDGHYHYDTDGNADVATLANDFSITETTAPWVVAGTSALVVTPQSEWVIAAMDEDGVTGNVTIQLTSGDDGTYHLDSGETTTTTV